MSCNKPKNTNLDFSGFLLENNTPVDTLETSSYHPINLCVDRVVRHAPFLICRNAISSDSNDRQYERIFPDKSQCLPIDPRPEHTNLASDSYLGAQCKKEKNNTNNTIEAKNASNNVNNE